MSNSSIESIAKLPIRTLVEVYPPVMPVLARFGMDLCCGGGHTITEAAELHGLDPALVLEEVRIVIEGSPE